jgi:alkylated DNA repair protein (DNA oxidative demethylase)
MLMPSGTPLRPRQTAQNKIHDGRQIAGSGKSPIKACSNMVKWPSPQALNIGIEGLSFYPGYLDRKAQAAMVARIRQVCEMAPLFTPRMPKSGRPFSVRMSNCGSLGWVSDQNGYRYQASHPDTGLAWPPLPHALMRLWNEVADYPYAPEACLINFYNASARMGLHQDRDEQDLAAPVVSLSLGDSCLFRVGGRKRTDPTRSVRLNSGDVVVLGGVARLAFHGVERIYPGTSTLLVEAGFGEAGHASGQPRGAGRINLTMRRVTRCPAATAAEPMLKSRS